MRFFFFIRLYLSLIRFDVELRMNGFEKVFPKYIKRYPVNYVLTRGLNDPVLLQKEIDEFLEMIDKVCAAYPFEAQCLHRSFLGYRHIRRSFGVPVELVVGVKKFPFSAHAWLMMYGENINETEEYTSSFTVILSSDKGVAA